MCVLIAEKAHLKYLPPPRRVFVRGDVVYLNVIMCFKLKVIFNYEEVWKEKNIKDI